MVYRVFADTIVVIHFAWILFMLVGFIFTMAGFWYKRFFDRWLFRMLHLCGIAYVSLLVLLGKYLYELNKDRIKDPNKLKVGQKIIIPVE